MDLSIVIPVFEESKKIGRDIEAASAFLVTNNLQGEIIIVDDGSNDKTCQVAGEAVEVPAIIDLRVLRNDHRGKGFAVRTGIKACRGKYVMLVDSG